MNTNDFLAQNELEKLLLSALDGGVDEEDFMTQLMDAQVYMPIQEDSNALKGFQHTTQAQPLIVEDDNGSQVLILFTSPERAKTFTQEHPGYGEGMLTAFSWVLRKMDPPLSIALNPGFDAGFDMDTAMVADLMAGLPPETL